MRGTLSGHSKGFAFLVPDDKSLDDVFIPPHEKNGAMHGDHVLVRIANESKGTRREGTVVRILKRGSEKVVGTYSESKYFGWLCDSR